MTNLKTKLIASLALVAAAGIAQAKPTVSVTAADVSGNEALLSIDYFADAAQPVQVIIVHVGLKGGNANSKAINLDRCTSGVSGAAWGGCSTAKGNIVVLVDGSGQSTPLASGQIGTVRVPKSALSTDAQGRITVPFVEFTNADSKTIAGDVMTDEISGGKEHGRGHAK